jgi:hypothetical protein
MAKRNKGASIQELLTVPEYLEVIHVLELGSCVSKTQNTMAKRQNTYNGWPLVSFYPFVTFPFFNILFDPISHPADI